jgi:hypothetical protein
MFFFKALSLLTIDVNGRGTTGGLRFMGRDKQLERVGIYNQ